MKNNKINRKTIILISIIVLVILIGIVCLTNIIRIKKINTQAINNINLEDNSTVVFCNGKNIFLYKSTYEKLKSNNIDLIINNDKYIAKVDNNTLDRKFSLNIKLKQNDNYRYDVYVNSKGIIELKVKLLNNTKQYISQYCSDELLTNKAVVTDEGFTEIELRDDKYEYTLAYIIPEDFDLNDISINKGASKNIELNIDEKNYTYGSVNITCDNQDAVEIQDFKILAKEVGNYKIYAKTDKVTKEAELKIEQSVEKIELSELTINLIKDNMVKVTANVIPDNSVNKELIWKSSDENIASVDNDGNIKALNEGNCEIIVSTKEEPIVTEKLQVEVKNKAIGSVSKTYPPFNTKVEGITYINGIMLVNKNYSIPQSYAPGLQNVAYSAFLDLKRDAAAAGFNIELLSGYRSYETQNRLYNNYVATYGQAEADTFSARPGTSEHQTGLAMDVGWIDDAYGDTPSGKWLAANCYKYGFIIRYPKNKENITGYKYEPWHIRYLGTNIAKDVYDSGLCLEEYLGV